MVTLLVLARLILVTTFAVAGGGKLSTPNRTQARSIEQFGIPASLAGFVAVVLPLFEFAVALGLMWGGHRPYRGRRGASVPRRPDRGRRREPLERPETRVCVYFGGFRPAKIGADTLVRNLILVAAAALLLACDPNSEFVQPRGPGASAWRNEIVLVVGLGLGLAAAGFQIWSAIVDPALGPTFLGRRSPLTIDQVRRKFTPASPAGLAIGANAPRFTLPLLGGGAVTLEWLGERVGLCWWCSRAPLARSAPQSFQRSRSYKKIVVIT